MMTQFGLASKAGIRADIDELCKATDIPHGHRRHRRGAQGHHQVRRRHRPPICKELGVDASGKLAADVTMLSKTCSVEATKFPLAVKELAELQIQYADIYAVMQQVPMFLNAANAPKKIEAPCVCAKGAEQCRDCKAKEHPCVCSRSCSRLWTSPCTSARRRSTSALHGDPPSRVLVGPRKRGERRKHVWRSHLEEL